MDKIVYTCDCCKTAKVESGSPDIKNWQMQHLHFKDQVVEFLTCPLCKTKNPNDLAAIAVGRTTKIAGMI